MILCDALNGGGECFCVLCFRSLSYFCWVWLFVAFLWVNLFSLRELMLIMKYNGWSGNWIFFRYNGAWALICFMLIVMNDAFMSYTHPLVVQRVYVSTPTVHSAAIIMPLLQHTAWIYVFFWKSQMNMSSYFNTNLLIYRWRCVFHPKILHSVAIFSYSSSKSVFLANLSFHPFSWIFSVHHLDAKYRSNIEVEGSLKDVRGG